MKKYIVRGCEDALIEALNEHGLACILGIPGVGKTTTARFVALKLREQGIIPIILTPTEKEYIDFDYRIDYQKFYSRSFEDRKRFSDTLKDKLVEFADERGEKHTVLQIPIAKYHLIDKDLAKSIAEAIANVVNTTLKDKILKKVSGITEKSDLVKKFSDVVKGVGKKLDIPREIVENAKSTLKEVSNFVDVEEVVKYGAEFCSCFLLGVDIVKLAEKLKGKGGELKLERKVAVIIDDVAGLNLSEKVALLTLVDWLRKNDAKVLLVRRINLEKEFIEISREISDSYVGYANEIFAGSRDARGFFEDKRQAVFMTTPDFDTFKEIIEANVEERLKPEDIGSLFQASGGSPTLAILMHDIGVKYGEETMKEQYYSLEEAKTDVEKARATLNIILNGVSKVYEEAKRMNLALLALFVQPTTREELETFCKSSEIEKVIGRWNYGLNLDSYKRIVEIREDERVDGERKFYELNENWRYMRLFLDVLCDREEYVRQEVEAVRRTLLDIMSEGREKTGKCTPRVLLYALKNIEWLKDNPNEKIMRQALDWGMVALIHSPKIGFAFRPTVLEIAKNVRSDDLLASSYAFQMVESCRVMNFPLEEAKEIVEKTEYLMRNRGENPAVMALRATTYSSIAKMLSGHDDGGEEERANYYMEQSEQVLSSISNEKVMNLAKISVWLGKAECYSHYLLLNKARIYAENAIALIEEVRGKKDDYTSDNFVCDFFKPLGEDVNEKFEEQFDEWYKDAKYSIGDIFMKFNQLEDAEEAFNDALKYSKVINDKLASLSRTARIKVFRNFEFVDFEELYEQMKEYEVEEYEVELLPELVMEISAEYMLSFMLLRKELEEKEKKRVMEHVKMDLIAYALLIGTAHKIFGAFDRDEVLNALEKLEMEEAGSSVETFASVLRMLIENEREKASEVAQRAVSVYAQYFPLFSSLFAELEDGIQRGDVEETNKALVKLFYLHV